MTQQEKLIILNKCLTMNEEERNSYFDTGVFNELVEAYTMKFLSNENIDLSKEEIHDKYKNIFDNLNAKDILKK